MQPPFIILREKGKNTMINNMTQHHYHMRYMNYLKYGLYSPPSEEGHDKNSFYPPVFSNFEDANRFLKDFWKNKTSMKNRNSYAKLAEEIEEYLTIQLYGNKSFNKRRTPSINQYNEETMELIVRILNEAGDIFKNSYDGKMTTKNLVAILSNSSKGKSVYRIDEKEKNEIETLKKVIESLDAEIKEINNTLKTGLLPKWSIDRYHKIKKEKQVLLKKLREYSNNNIPIGDQIPLDELNKILSHTAFSPKITTNGIGQIAEYAFTIMQTNFDILAQKKVNELTVEEIQKIAKKARNSMTGNLKSKHDVFIDNKNFLFDFVTKIKKNKKTNSVTIVPDKSNYLFKSWDKIMLDNGILFTEQSQMTTDLSIAIENFPTKIQERAKSLGLKNINESLKNYSSKKKVAMISRTPLINILDLDPYGRFSMHYLNFISGSRTGEEKDPFSFDNFHSGLKTLFVARSLMGIKNSSNSLENAQNTKEGFIPGANEFIVINDRRNRKVSVYSAYDILDYILYTTEENAIIFDKVPDKTNLKWHGRIGKLTDSQAKSRVLNKARDRKVSAKMDYTTFDK